MLNEKIERLLKLALALTSQEWSRLGLGDDPLTQPTSEKGILVERITSLLLVRSITIACYTKNQSQLATAAAAESLSSPPIPTATTTTTTNPNKSTSAGMQQQQSKTTSPTTMPYIFTNLSTSGVCQQLLEKSVEFPSDVITDVVVDELREYVRRMIDGYKEVPYHNREHAFHVVLSVNKLLDMMISGKNQFMKAPSSSSQQQQQQSDVGNGNNRSSPAQGVSTNNVATNVTQIRRTHQHLTMSYVTYGLRHDPIALFAMIFASLIHDVEHQGIPNRQLAVEDDRLAVLYNDQSMAENWSLYVGFSELLQNDFSNLRKATLQENTNEYRRFRSIVIDLVLSTDIASPERTQINKSKWKEAFGDPYETIERKMKLSSLQFANSNNNPISNGVSNIYNYNNNDGNTGIVNNTNFNGGNLSYAGRRFSLTGRHITAPRRASNLSTISAVSYNGHSLDEEVDHEYNAEDDSLSATPDQSESEVDGDHNMTNAVSANKSKRTDVVTSSTRGSVQGLRANYERRMSAVSGGGNSVNTAKYRQRLGILRTVDLSGETFETYSRRGSMHSTCNVSTRSFETSEGVKGATTGNGGGGGGGVLRAASANAVYHTSNTDGNLTPLTRNASGCVQRPVVSRQLSGNGTMNDSGECNMSLWSTNPAISYDADEPDDLKASVVMETILTAADVAHNLQGWDHMVKWSSRLYLELRRAYVAGRGSDPADRWFENQIGFLESYLLPLARRLEDTGVFNDIAFGTMFSGTVESNRDTWLTDGFEVTQKSVDDGKERYPN